MRLVGCLTERASVVGWRFDLQRTIPSAPLKRPLDDCSRSLELSPRGLEQIWDALKKFRLVRLGAQKLNEPWNLSAVSEEASVSPNWTPTFNESSIAAASAILSSRLPLRLPSSPGL